MPTWAAQRLGIQNPDLVPSIGTTTTTTKKKQTEVLGSYMEARMIQVEI